MISKIVCSIIIYTICRKLCDFLNFSQLEMLFLKSLLNSRETT